ncbi:MAG: Hsp33 family molecular chaperone HslO [Gammaproteobacteria bacterium]|nr:Hsp33 family molecular chaperone HslO [Gammaproteobacteria bacterium]
MKEKDIIRRFMFENIPVRGEIVHLDATWRAVLERNQYPEIVKRTLAEFMAAAALLSSTLKFEGTLSFQVTGDGPISLMVMEASNDHTLRGVAKHSEDMPEQGTLHELFGKGNLVITIENNITNERYQGIIELIGNTIAEALEYYLTQSEQLDTRLWLATDNEQATGMLLQRMPGKTEPDADDWNRLTTLASTMTEKELVELSAQEILHRLYHEEDIRLMDAEPVFFRCSCSRERVRNMLRGLGLTEVRSIIEEKGLVDINCEMCGQQYIFDRIDAEEIFASDTRQDIPPTKH